MSEGRQTVEEQAARAGARGRRSHVRAAPRAPSLRHRGESALAEELRREAVDPAAIRWMRIAYDDLTGIDGDIERILAALQEKHGYARPRARAELVRRLSLSLSS